MSRELKRAKVRVTFEAVRALGALEAADEIDALREWVAKPLAA